MKGRVILFDRIEGREAAALVVDGRLEDLLIDPEEDTLPLPGAILRAVVDRPVKGQGGVFVKLPAGTGFLREARGLAPGQRVLVQVSGWAEPGKALPLTLRLLFKSQLVILTPGAPGLNVSRSLRDAQERDRLAAIAAGAMAGAAEDLGLIMRSAAARAGDEDIAADIAAMRDLTEAVLADTAGGPELLLDGSGAQDTAWRDWFEPEPDEVEEREGAFRAHGIEDLVAEVLTPRAALPGGGSLVIEPTRALVAVDVNTGADTSPAAGLKANIAAARDLPRQLRLRGLGGQIAVDFAPMPKKDRAAVEQVLRAAFRADGVETSLAGWTPLGLYELQRKRERRPLVQGLA